MSSKNIFEPFISPIGQFSYPVLFEPKEDFSKKLKYSIEILFEKGNPETKKIKEYLVNCVRERFDGKIPAGFKNYVEFKDGDQRINKKTNLPYAEYAGKEFLVLKSNVEHKPKVYDQYAKQSTDKNLIVGGDYGVVVFSAMVYGPPNVPTWGMTALLRGAQLNKKTDKPFGSGGTNIDYLIKPVENEISANEFLSEDIFK